MVGGNISMSNRLFYVAQYFTPEPYLKDINFIKSLKDKGWDPVVITGFPNYPKGEIYSGYKNSVFKIEEMEGIKVIRTYTYADHSLNVFKRILNYLCFGILASYAIFKFGKKESFYYVLQSSPFVIFTAWTVKLFKSKSKTLLDIQDVFPENIRVSGVIKQGWIINILDFILNNFYYRFFDFFVTVSNSFNKIVQSKGISKSRVLTLYNWSMVEADGTTSSDNYQFAGNFYNIVYAGNIGVHQGLSLLTDAYKLVQEKYPKIKFHFFGDGTDFEALKSKLKEKQIHNVELHGRVSSTEISKYLNAADCLFLHLISDPIYESIIPSKLQAYVEVGKPILGGIQGEAAELVSANNLGEVFNSEDNNAMLKAIEVLYNMDASTIEKILNNSKQLYADDFSRAAGATKVDNFLKQNIVN
ncbi:Glycosyltransferase involved in cell wall bisynthesis [Soonwooa buanensis]|uniref:Glycosyltransferase involved in cell wall bisynthesis n=2 Tax=Soonwooa buanensis TaxID=619805 RepID=A0A1T5EUW7_9FLAO|nr:Glycosyltransferase involved in cell wall bisynthesis [Soonwooa buanensis]